MVSREWALVLDKTPPIGVNRIMQRVRIIKTYKQYRAGDVVNLSPNEAFGLIDKQVAIISKDMTQSDYTQKVPKKGKKIQVREK